MGSESGWGLGRRQCAFLLQLVVCVAVLIDLPLLVSLHRLCRNARATCRDERYAWCPARYRCVPVTILRWLSYGLASKFLPCRPRSEGRADANTSKRFQVRDYKGTIIVNRQEFWLSSWLKKNAAGKICGDQQPGLTASLRCLLIRALQVPVRLFQNLTRVPAGPCFLGSVRRGP
jgi:hypothetical protein